jgi:acetyl esterase/lipase
MTVLLWPDTTPYLESENQENSPTLSPFLVPRGGSRSAIIICPGGGYHHLANHEGEPIAKWLNNQGISAFVLNYRVSPFRHPVPLADIQRAIRFVRYHSAEWNLDPQKIGVLGFSAGGHLAASASTLINFRSYEPSDRIDQESCRPDLAILCYPVISLLEHYHEGSVYNLLGNHPMDELRALMSNERNVSKATPPTFLWHTADDASVPVENSMLYAQALSKWNVPFELHIFPNGRHGLGLAEENPIVSKWTDLCTSWLANQDF